MRPDEHKKKKNAQYKKKHGIKSSDSEHNRNENETKSKKSDQKLEDFREAGANSSSLEGINTSAGSLVSEDKLPSNWERYEITEEVPSQRGEDFNLLLQTTSNAISQFRFKDEQGWLEDEVEVSQLLSLDCSQVAAALRCIPLHHRLGMDASCFEREDIEQFEKTAVHERSLYQENVSNPTHSSCPVYGDVDIASLVTSLLSTTDDTDNLSQPPGRPPPSRSQNQIRDTYTTQPFSPPAKPWPVDIRADVSDVLDDILSLSQPVLHPPDSLPNAPPVDSSVESRAPTSQHNQPNEQQTSVQAKQTNIEDELDFLLSLQETSEENKTSRKMVHSDDNSALSDKRGSLEDWLDDVLAD